MPVWNCSYFLMLSVAPDIETVGGAAVPLCVLVFPPPPPPPPYRSPSTSTKTPEAKNDFFRDYYVVSWLSRWLYKRKINPFRQSHVFCVSFALPRRNHEEVTSGQTSSAAVWSKFSLHHSLHPSIFSLGLLVTWKYTFNCFTGNSFMKTVSNFSTGTTFKSYEEFC